MQKSPASPRLGRGRAKLQFKIKNILLFVFSFLLFIFNLNEARAARLYFEPQELVAGTEKEFVIAVNIDAQNSINALSVALSISPGFTPYDTSDGNSIINLWLDKPNWDEATRLLTFSGIIPGGFSGKGARLLVIKFKPQKPGLALLDFDKEKTKIYLNTPDGIEDSLQLEQLSLPVVAGKENLPVQLPDKDPPEQFSPEIIRDQNIFDNKWFLVFATQDKGSGIAAYAIHESRRIKTQIDTKDWALAQSPYLLKDQELKSYVYLKATDKAGNERIVTLPPRYPIPWYESYLFLVIIILIVLVAVLVCLIGKLHGKEKQSVK